MRGFEEAGRFPQRSEASEAKIKKRGVIITICLHLTSLSMTDEDGSLGVNRSRPYN